MENRSFIDLKFSSAQWKFISSNATIVALIGPFGEGKCHPRGTKVLMYSGELKNVEDVRVGDKLMGDDSTPRTVLALGRGKDDIYEIIPKRGEPFRVNKSHILSLKRTKHCNHKPEKNVPWIVNVSVEDYLKRSRTFRSSHLLYRVPVNFKKKKVAIDPYWLGLWLGDGNNHNTGITTTDNEIIHEICKYAEKISQKVSVTSYKNRTTTYTITGAIKGKNRLLDTMREMKLIGNKHIPLSYKANSRDVRLKLLAGIIDTDGTPNKTSYQICQKSERLTDDILFLARSLGFAAYKKKVMKKCCNTGKIGIYFNITIDGDCSIIPTKVKKVPKRKQKKSVLVTGIRSIKPVGKDDYYGFIIDKNHLYLLGDFTVTHNTFAGFWGLAYHARKFWPKPMYGAIIRDTFENLKNQTFKSINEASSGLVQWAEGGKKMRFNNAEIDLFGIDDIASLSKLQGAEYTFIWLEEPAPIAAKENAGLREEVFTTALTRVGRQKSAIPRLQITMNPADEEHWTYKRLILDPINSGGVTTEVFHIPYGSNWELKDEQRELVKQSFKDSPDLYERYVRGNFSFIQFGEAVTPEYNEMIHRSKEILYPDPSREVFRFWDGGLHPTPYDDKTEILTQKGWMNISEVNVGDMVITLNPLTFNIEYQPIIEVKKAIYEGEMYHWRCKHYDLRVTAEHSIPSMNRKTKKITFKMACKVGDVAIMPKSGNWKGEDVEYFIFPEYHNYSNHFPEVKIPFDVYCKFMGLYLSEGSTEASKKYKSDDKPKHYMTYIWQKYRDKKMEDVLDQLPFKWHWTGNGWKTASVQLYNYLKDFGYSYQKWIPSQILNASRKNIRQFLEYYLMGDGIEGRKIITSSKKMADGLQELCLKAGYSASINIIDNIGKTVIIKDKEVLIDKLHYIVNISMRAKTTNLKKHNLFVENTGRQEKVYCVVVPNHIVYVRRNGKPMWGGNCVFMQITPKGRFFFLDTVRGENIGVKQLIETRVIPLINDRYRDCKMWRDIGDPSMAQREQSDSSQTAADVINEALGAAFEPGEKSWQNRREALKEMFNRMIGGEPMFLLSRHDTILHRCFRGGWHYAKDPSGRIMRDRPVKDIHSHPGDAVSHGIARILLRPKMLDRLSRIKEITRQKWGISGMSDIYGRRKGQIIPIK